MAVPHAKLPVEEIKRRLISIYSIFKTENVSKVDHLLQKYAGQEEFLYQTVCSKYNVDERAFSAAVPPVKSAPRAAPAAPLFSDFGGVHPSAWAVPKSTGIPAVMPSPPPQGAEAVPVAPWSKSSPMQRTAVLHQDVPVQQSDSQPLPVKAHPLDIPALMHKAAPAVPPQPLQNGNANTPPNEAKASESALAMPAALPVKAPPPLAPAATQPQPVAEFTGGSVESGQEPLKNLDEDATMKEEQEAFFALVRAASTAEGGLETRKSGGSNPHDTDVSSAAGSPAQVEGSPPLKKQKLAAATPIAKSVSDQPDDAPKPASESGAQGTSEATATGQGEEEQQQNMPVDDYDAEDSVLGDDEDARLQEALLAMHRGADSAVEDVQAAEITGMNIVDIDTVLLGERSGFFQPLEDMQAGSAGSDAGDAGDDSGSSSSDESDENSVAEQDQAEPHEPQAEDPTRLPPAVEMRSEPAVAEAAPPVTTSATPAIPNGSAAELNGAADVPVLKDGYGTDPSSSEGESDSESSNSASAADEAKVGGTNEEHALRWRLHVGGQIFAALDRKHAGRLRSGEMLKFARFSGFDGTKEDWNIAYTQLCQDQQCNPKEGLTKEAFLNLINDESDRGCFCSNAELRSICENIAPAALQVMEAPSMGA